MDQKAFVSTLAQRMSCDNATAAGLLDKLSALLADQCSEENRIAIPGFGTFEGLKHDEEITTDLASGKRMLLPPSIEVKFTAGGMLKKHIKEGPR